jgi:hypothetical protein
MLKIDDSRFNALQWRDITPAKLEELLEGATIQGFELCNYPLTDGVILEVIKGDRHEAAIIENDHRGIMKARIAKI